MLSIDRLRVKLQAFDGMIPVAYTHDFAVCGLRRNVQTIRQRLTLNGKRVIRTTENGLGNPEKMP